ncbi:MAG TPA: adenine deaminase [Selenomonadales bacterium]|nr:adenine deaminase [Selenomonadales bacterium]
MKPVSELIAVARGRAKAELALKNARVFNVFTGEFVEGDVAVVEGYVAGVGTYSGHREVELGGAFVTPGFIDSHVHIESSMVSPAEFAKIVAASGTTTVVADPHEIANVLGTAGVRYMLEATEALPVTVYIMLPSCVPATGLETAGAALEAEDLAEFIGHPRVLGLGELMDWAGVLAREDRVLAKLALAEGKLVDGHAPGLQGAELTAYAAAGARSDHECATPAEALARLRQGMYVMLREGTAAKNLLDLLPAINRHTARWCLLATDDRHPADLVGLGHINHLVGLAVAAGADVAAVLQMATINAAGYLGIRDLGAVAPGYRADLLVLDNLTDWRPAQVYKAGRLIAEKGRLLVEPPPRIAGAEVRRTVRLGEAGPAALHIPARSSRARVMGLIPRQLITTALEIPVPAEKGGFVPDPARDIAKIAVFERHRGSGRVGVGLVQGFGLKEGALASTIAHDSHNLIVVGVSEPDMLLAVREVAEMQGGLAIVRRGRVLGSLALPLGGLMSGQDIYAVHSALLRLHALAGELGVPPGQDPFMQLSFLSLPVIPELKITDRGLVDVRKAAIVPVSL